MPEIDGLVNRTKELIRRQPFNEYAVLEVLCRMLVLLHYKLNFYHFKSAFDALFQNKAPPEEDPEIVRASTSICEMSRMLQNHFGKTPEISSSIIRAVPHKASGEGNICVSLIGYNPNLASEDEQGPVHRPFRRQIPEPNPKRTENPMPKSVAVPDVSAVLMKARNLVESGSFEAEPVIVTLARFLLLHENQLGLSEEEQQEALSKYNIRGKRKTENLQKACSILRDIRQFAMDLGKNKDEAEKLIACAQRPAPKEELIIDALLSASKEAPATAGKPAKRTYRRRKATEPRTTAVSKDGSSLISQLRQKASELEAQADVLLKKAGNLRIEADELQQHEEEAAKLLQ